MFDFYFWEQKGELQSLSDLISVRSKEDEDNQKMVWG